MAKTNIITKEAVGFSFIVLAYRDYIAARFLLKNGFTLQGLTLASSAVEKYLKVLLILNGKSKNEINVHLNRLPQLQQALASCYYDITQKIDLRFLTILGKVYGIRYYDDVKTPVSFGFFINQFIGELDYVVHLMETVVITGIKNARGENMQTPYQRDVVERKPELYDGNYTLLGISKIEYMEQEDTGFAVYIAPDSLAHGELRVIGERIKNAYKGLMADITLIIN